MERNKTLDVYKGILIILVVLRHVLQYTIIDNGGLISNIIWAVQMPGFMMVSGYFSYKNGVDKNDLGKSLIKNVYRYFVPFVSWFLLINVFLLGEYNRNPLSALNILFHRVDVGLWFLWVIFILQIVSTINNFILSSSLKIRKFLFLLNVVIFYLIIGVIYIIKRDLNLLGIKLILYYSIFFFVGWMIGYKKKIFTGISKKIMTYIFFISLIIFSAICFNYDLFKCEDNIFSIILRFVTGITGNLIIYYVIDNSERLKNRNKLSFVGMYTLEIYTSHMYVNNLFASHMEDTLYSINGMFIFLLSFIVTVLFTAIIIMILKSNKISNFIFFGKIKK